MNRYNFDFGVALDNLPILLNGLYLTFEVTIASLLIGGAIGLMVGLIRAGRPSILSSACAGYIEIFRNTPALVQLMWVYYCLPMLSGWSLSAKTSVIITLGLNASAYFAEIVRGGVKSIDIGQFEAARCLGLSQYKTMTVIVLPQALARMQPAFVNEAITIIKYSSLVSVLGVADLTYQANVVSTTTFRPIETFTITAAIYFFICYLLSYFALRLESRRARFG